MTTHDDPCPRVGCERSVKPGPGGGAAHQTRHSAAGDPHDDPLVTAAARWLCVRGPHVYDDGIGPLPCKRHVNDAAGLVAALRPHIDAEKQATGESLAQDFEDRRDFYDPTVFSPDGTSPDAIVAKAMRHAYTQAAQMAREMAAGGGRLSTDPAGGTAE
jgi:hypothetical protein